ncbi:hypothetical protein OG250_39575 [Streptomyces sp. NBC_00487]|uniref:hypothetical protein n=1 Tax=unclassified Streptomyces TaxID=2593676 RepID=UPI002E17F3A2|nr:MULTISPECIES: hypothetical protein [unclassified Streptomyces]
MRDGVTLARRAEPSRDDFGEAEWFTPVRAFHVGRAVCAGQRGAPSLRSAGRAVRRVRHRGTVVADEVAPSAVDRFPPGAV